MAGAERHPLSRNDRSRLSGGRGGGGRDRGAIVVYRRGRSGETEIAAGQGARKGRSRQQQPVRREAAGAEGAAPGGPVAERRNRRNYAGGGGPGNGAGAVRQEDRDRNRQME